MAGSSHHNAMYSMPSPQSTPGRGYSNGHPSRHNRRPQLAGPEQRTQVAVGAGPNPSWQAKLQDVALEAEATDLRLKVGGGAWGAA